jgi:UDP-glucose 6-dehydrogenase
MPDVLHLKPEDIDTNEKRGKYTVSVIGCWQKGVLYATVLAEAGFKVICTDADQSLVKRVARGKTPFSEREIEAKLKTLVRTGQLSTTNELKSAVAQSDIVIMALTAKIDGKKAPDYSEVESSCKQVGAALRRGALFTEAQRVSALPKESSRKLWRTLRDLKLEKTSVWFTAHSNLRKRNPSLQSPTKS